MDIVITAVARTASIIIIWLAEIFAVYRFYNTTLPNSVRFAIPALLSFVFFLAAMRLPMPRRPKTPLTISLLFAVLLGFCSFWMAMFISLYAFGA